jgi:choline dehydrogenase-like flavoprotein
VAPKVDPVQSDEVLPARADVVIIGGGIIGASTALFLAQKGIRAVLCEKGHIAGEQSSRNWGWCRKMARDPRELPLIIESLRLWGGMNELVEAETGFRQAGIMYLAETQAELAQLETWLEHARQYQLDTRILTRAEAAELMPGLTGNWTGALYTASDGKAEPQRAAPAIAEAARCGDRDPMRRTRHRNRRRARLRGGDRKGPRRLRQGCARRRRMVPAVLRQSRRRAAAAQSAGDGHAHSAARRRPGDLGIGRAFRVSQTDGRRLHRRDPRGADDRPRTR